MAWTDPKTWSAEVLTSSDLNTHLRDNLLALKDPPSDDHTANEASDYQTSSTSFGNVDGTDLSLTISTNGGDVMVHFHGTVSNTGAGASCFDFTVDGVRHGGDDGVARGGGVPDAVAFTVLVTGLTAGSHTFNLQWKATSGTQVLYAGAATSSFDIHPQFWVREVS